MKNTQISQYELNKYMPRVGLYSNNPEPLAFARPNEALARLTKADLLDIPEATVVELSDGSSVRMYEVNPLSDYDESRVIVRVMDFANGIAPHSYASALAVAELLGHRVIVLPQNDISLSKKDRQIVKSGDFAPITSKQSEGLEEVIDNDGSVTIYGYSLGAQAGLGLSKAINSGGVLQNDRLVLAEPPNTAQRSKLQLLKDFSVAGNYDWANATLESRWDALIDVVGILESDISNYMKRDNAKFARSAARLSNIAILGAMQHPTFAKDLQTAGLYLPTDSRVLIAKERFSAIVPTHGLEDAFDYASPHFQKLGLGLIAVQMNPGTKELSLGHAVGNNPFIVASLIERSAR